MPQKRKCNVCLNPAVVVDTEYDEYYCHKHALNYQVYDGPHRELEKEETNGQP